MDYIIALFDGKNLRLYPVTCLSCGNIFYVPKYLLKKRKYCSMSCAHKKVEKIKKCSYCEKEFTDRRVELSSKSGFLFCSRKCKDKAQSVSGGEKFLSMRPSHYPKANGRACLYCGKIVGGRKKYCDVHCAAKHRSENDFKKWLLNPDSKISGSSRRKIVEMIGCICSECGLGDVWNGKYLSLQLHHIDGNNQNNKIENLTVLCPNCHAQTDTYCGKSSHKNDLNREVG